MNAMLLPIAGRQGKCSGRSQSIQADSGRGPKPAPMQRPRNNPMTARALRWATEFAHLSGMVCTAWFYLDCSALLR